MKQCISHSAPTVLVKKYTPCQGVVWSQYSLPETFYVPLSFGGVLINNHTNHKNYDATMHQSFSTYFTVLVKNTHLAKVWFGHNTVCQARLCSIRFWCGFVCQGVFFLTSTVLKSCRFYTGFTNIVPKL